MDKCEANYTALTPITFLERAAMFYGDRNSIIYGQTRFTWRQTYDRCRRLASSLRGLGIAKNDVVSVLAPNVPALYEMHFAAPMAGGVLNAINTRLDANNIKTILEHSQAKILLVDYEYLSLANEALSLLNIELKKPPYIITINEIHSPANKMGNENNNIEYEELISMGNENFVAMKIDDEWDPIALNYTSGTTSTPKGVVYSHRGAYLSTLSMILGWEMGTQPIYLWSLPMFHCNGWTFTWGVAARGGTNVCIRNTSAPIIYQSIALHNITHMCCAPIVLNMLVENKPKQGSLQLGSRVVQILTGGSPPSANLLKEMDELGFHVTHAYGLTEATGPVLVSEWQKNWDHLSQEQKARLKSRQGISVLHITEVDVKDVGSMRSVPKDGKSTGEIVLRGSGMMKGYLKNEKATMEVFRGGWFHTGDVAVIHHDGYIEIKDRLKDVIISGGENISSVEVEGVIFQHPKVLEVAVVAMPHPKWGESPCAFIVSKENMKSVTQQELIWHCRNKLPHYMVPKKICFVTELPKTSTGKVQKAKLREIAKTFQVSIPKNDVQEIKEIVSRL